MDLLFVHTINNMDLFLSLHKAQLPDLYEQDVDPRLYQTNTLKDLAFFWEMSHKKSKLTILSASRRLTFSFSVIRNLGWRFPAWSDLAHFAC